MYMSVKILTKILRSNDEYCESIINLTYNVAEKCFKIYITF